METQKCVSTTSEMMKSALLNIQGKPLPYYSTETIRGERELASDLREMVPKLERRLPEYLR